MTSSRAANVKVNKTHSIRNYSRVSHLSDPAFNDLHELILSFGNIIGLNLGLNLYQYNCSLVFYTERTRSLLSKHCVRISWRNHVKKLKKYQKTVSYGVEKRHGVSVFKNMTIGFNWKQFH